ncbi:hypothetical protein TNCV_4095711 [Trichonephila clavipes]|uniref:Protein-tyrosine phosphatase receptor IA-2 ectodomain domain-containing protein n=1 Tax=Trichonephila clavipes TaxID=2585209 RepID=A0A8X6SFY9_TRICX|nr:hypothetical protein TNCV_4095711 [Trichonephila clavipes]
MKFDLQVRPTMYNKRRSPSEENALNLVKALEKFLELDRGSFSNIKVKGQRITFKVNPNSKGYNATEVATKADLSPHHRISPIQLCPRLSLCRALG